MQCRQCNAPLGPDARFCGVCGHAVHDTRDAVTGPGTAAAGGPGALDPMVGRTIAGRYRLVARLGEGGMGAVFRAEQLSLKREVALKLLRPELSANPDLVRRFNAEAELAARLNHPNTVTLYDFGQDSDGTLFIAMELIAGRSLRHVIAENPLPATRALPIAGQIAASLADAHGHGIVHRDLKPDNVMLSTRGKQEDVVRVLDFGIAKLRDQPGGATGAPMTQAGALLGTPQYMAPEQVRGEAVDGRTDVYALGAILYEMITGCLVFEGKSLMAILSKHLTEEPTPPSRRRPDLAIPPAVEQAILHALQKAPEHRPRSMEQFAEILAGIAQTLHTGPGAAPVSMSGVAPLPAPAFTPAPVSAAAFTPAPASTPAPAFTPAPVSTPPAAMVPPGFVPGPPHHAPPFGRPPVPAAGPPLPGRMPPAGPFGPRRRSRSGIMLAITVIVLVGAAAFVVRVRSRARAVSPEAGSEPAAISTDFTVPPKRTFYSDDSPGDSSGATPEMPAPAKPDSPAGSRYVHPVYGYAVDLPGGFTEVSTGSAELVRFDGMVSGAPAVIAVAHLDITFKDLDEQSLRELAAGLASLGEGKLVRTGFRKIQGRRRLTGVVDVPDEGLRYEFAVLPCGDEGMVVMFGAPPGKFAKSKSMRRDLFDKRVIIP